MSIWLVLKICQVKKGFIVRWWVSKTTDKEYEHVFKVWDRFGMKAMKDYHDLYLKYDALLLGDVFKNFRNCSLKNEQVIIWMHQLLVGMQY